jgi:phosphohistidine phosphatase
MKLYVMRHGPAEDDAPSGMDGDRALSPSGRGRVVRVADRLVEADEQPVLIVTSPLARAVQTAEIVAVIVAGHGHRDGTVEVHREMAPGGAAERLVRQMASEGKRRVMVVGHEPDLSGLVAALVGSFGRPFEKAMVVGLHLAAEGGRAKLRFVLDPKSLELEKHPSGDA